MPKILPGGGGLSTSGGTISGDLAITGTLDVTGVATFTTTVTGSGNIMAGAAFAIGFTGRSQWKSSADGVLEAYAADGSTRASIRSSIGTTAVPGFSLPNSAGTFSGNRLYVTGGASAEALFLVAGGFDWVKIDRGASTQTFRGTLYISSADVTTMDAGMAKLGTGVVKPVTTSAAAGDMQAPKSILTAGTMTATSTVQSLMRRSVSKFAWTNAMVTALGAATTGDITICTLPAKFVVTNVLLVVDTAETALTSLTGAVGRTGAGYIDYVVASSLKAAANTVYGDADAERGTNMSPTKAIDLPSYTGTTDVKMHFISGVENLDQAVACTGTVLIEGYLLP